MLSTAGGCCAVRRGVEGSDPSAANGRYSGESGAALPAADKASRFQGSAPSGEHVSGRWTDGTTRAIAAQKFWAPQQEIAAAGKSTSCRSAKHLKANRKREDLRPPFSLPYKPQGDKSPGYREDTPAVQCTGRLSFHYNEKRGKSKPIFSQKIADALVQIVKSCTKTAPGRRSGSGLVSQRSGFQSEGPPPKRSSAWNSPSSRGG